MDITQANQSQNISILGKVEQSNDYPLIDTLKKVTIFGSTMIGFSIGAVFSFNVSSNLVDFFYPVEITNITPLTLTLTFAPIIYFTAIGSVIGGLIGKVTTESILE